MLCDWQPHPLYFVWAFLFGGLIRTHTSLRAPLGTSRAACLLVELAVADLFGFQCFYAFASHLLPTVGGVVSAWLLSLVLVFPVRLYVTHRAGLTRTNGSGCALFLSSLDALSTLPAAAFSSSLLLVLCMLVLKYVLDERGDALDATAYAWHITTFYLGSGFAIGCVGQGLRPEDRSSTSWGTLTSTSMASYDFSAEDATARDSVGGTHSSDTRADSPTCKESPKKGMAIVGSHGLAFATMAAPSAAAPFAASSVVVGALGVLPRSCCTRPDRFCALRWLPLRGTSASAVWTLAIGVALAWYVLSVRLVLASEAAIGPLVEPCRTGPANPEPDVIIGEQWSLLSLMYGTRSVAIPARCMSGAGMGGSAAGIVMAADGSQDKYAQAVYIALHVIRALHRSNLPVEIFHVGHEEGFAQPAADRLKALGGVEVLDMLPRLHPAIRRVAAQRLRSFAAKPFALLASTFETVILVDANALFFSPPDVLLQLHSFRTVGVQLFTDYVRAYHIVDPWLVSSYIGSSLADVDAYTRITQGAECDSSVVVIDKSRAWRYLNVVAALNWWKAIVDRHTWGDKDTWALAAIALANGGGGEAHASSDGSLVGWLTRTTTTPPSAVWGHVQFDALRAANGSGLLYLNWQPHYAAGFIDLEDKEHPGGMLACCVMLHDHWPGPHDEKRLWPTVSDETVLAHSELMSRTFADARTALQAAGTEIMVQPHWWGQVRYRRCTIYFAVFATGACFAIHSALVAMRSTVRSQSRMPLTSV